MSTDSGQIAIEPGGRAADIEPQLRLLVVDDDSVDRERIRRLLGRDNTIVIEAETGREALAALQLHAIDCAFVDYRLPDIDGLSLLGQLLAHDVSVVMLTGQDDTTIAVEAMKRGAEDYLVKGRLDADTLKRALAHAGEKRSLRKKIAQQQAELRAHISELDRQRDDLERSNVALHQREAKLRVLVEHLPAIVWTTDLELRYTSAAGMCWSALGVDPSALIGGTVQRGSDDAALLDAHRRALLGERVQFEARLGSASYLNYVEPLYGENGTVDGIAGMAIDVTNTRALEQQLRVAQKMDALGKLAGGVAHDFNNILMAILSFGAFARDALPRDCQARSDLEQVLMAAQRATKLVSQLLAFSRHDASEPGVVHIGEVITNIMSMLSRLVGESITLRFAAANELWNVRIAPTSLEQVVMNLVVNARDAMPGGGEVSLEAHNATLNPNAMASRPGKPTLLTAGDYVVLSVADAGAGIPADVLERIFEPFFTTKGPGKGTGLGLSTCYGIVGQAGGEIVVQSELGRGTEFRVYLPRSLLATGASAPITDAGGISGHGTILLVEDDAQVGAVAGRTLREHGYRVLIAATPTEALALYQEYRADIDLVLSDVVMPEMMGPELVERIRASRPEIAAVYMTGYVSQALRERWLTAFTGVLEKPFSVAALTRRVRDALGRR